MNAKRNETMAKGADAANVAAKAETAAKADSKADATPKGATDAPTLLHNFARGIGSAVKAESGARVLLVQAGIAAGNVAAFDKAVAGLYHDIRKNVRGFAKAVGAELTKKGKEYAVPGNIRTPVSQLRDAIERGVNLGTMAEPRGFGAIREDAKKHRDDEEKGSSEDAARAADPLYDARQRVLSALDDAAAFVRDVTDEATLKAVAASLLPLAKIMAKAEADKAEASKAEEIAKAA